MCVCVRTVRACTRSIPRMCKVCERRLCVDGLFEVCRNRAQSFSKLDNVCIKGCTRRARICRDVYEVCTKFVQSFVELEK